MVVHAGVAKHVIKLLVTHDRKSARFRWLFNWNIKGADKLYKVGALHTSGQGRGGGFLGAIIGSRDCF